MGIAYSLGFIIGPVIGALFAKGSALGSGSLYLPAMFAVFLSIVDIAFVFLCMKETLPQEKRVNILNHDLVCNIQYILTRLL